MLNISLYTVGSSTVPDIYNKESLHVVRIFSQTITLICLSLAKSDIDFLHVFPDLVLGRPLTATAKRNDAIGPINSRTIVKTSRLTAASFFLASATKLSKLSYLIL